jgi:hypothetical protein
MTDNLKTGKGDASPDTSAHTPGVKSGNSKGNYDSQPGHLPDGRSSAKRSTGVNADSHNPIDPRMPNLSPG